MNYVLKNEKISVTINGTGTELFSAIDRADGCEYIWQGNPKYWEDRAPVLFPVCSSFFNDTYTCDGKEYKMCMHGFAQNSEFTVKSANDSKIVFSLTSNENTRAQYPFDFDLELTYSIVGRELFADATIKNTSNKIMPVSYGAHPGFNVPLSEGNDFEDYYIEFSEECQPEYIIITDDGFVSEKYEKLELTDNKKLPLRHSLFVPDGIFMRDMAREVTLKSDGDKHFVTMKFEDMPSFGIWQEFSDDTPFLCLEPWCAPPDNCGVPQDIYQRRGMFMLEPNEEKKIRYSIIFG